jgi:hypothetical protein
MSGEVDRLLTIELGKASEANCLDDSYGEENNEIEYITLGHLCSGLLEENMGEDADHICDDWQTMSKKKSSSSKKKLNIPSNAHIKKRVNSEKLILE